ncbi:uncharacterized protein NP_3014A [Natronomonas pharaonis DSM 2160]|uniref:Uncharacterized protein n=1 Tax=Natronomonas pharaonis (strain ATCC 35678 / DSM 2160 / CIP 103997 / JCM 8858 / NBRC 14720 / NCIMB 2260 / Gabara) TaxID=348780 RepID=A0A1U7EWW3_NATPD|nr:hypothetical protein [Natronomonas pharaonis]CAI49598.1 uncharacterized protein NP_3014A [Natronomonas pharaonis DSM 2160]
MYSLRLDCYRCGTEYGYVGAMPHPGQCPACDSPCVPPAGTLTVTDSLRWESANGLAKVWIRTLDERDRPFEFEIAANGSRGKLAGLKIDGIKIDPNAATALERLPEAVADEIDELGITELDTATREVSK